MHAEHGLLGDNIVIYAPAHEAVAISPSAGSDYRDVWARKYFMAFAASIFSEHVPWLPFLNSDPGLVVLQINHPPDKGLFTDDLPASIYRTPLGGLRYRRG